MFEFGKLSCSCLEVAFMFFRRYFCPVNNVFFFLLLEGQQSYSYGAKEKKQKKKQLKWELFHTSVFEYLKRLKLKP